MADLEKQFGEIKSLLASNNKSLAYSTLLQFQELSTADVAYVQILSDASHTILSSIVDDICDDDEEIASQALKCLGFMIYHPSIVASITSDDAYITIESLVKVITTTRIKSVCNLGVWCISMQQFNSSLLDFHFHSLLRAIMHAIDNPMGSFSTTFEAMQAVVKLASSRNKKMRGVSHIWAPSIYRRLVNADKRVRNMSERCLLKIRTVLYPPPVSLSKAFIMDLKKNLLSAMKELIDQGMKIQSLQAWGWFIRLLGPYAMKNKHLVNDMLKIPEQTFSDIDPQIQIATLVAWEGLIDTFVEFPDHDLHTNLALKIDAREKMISEVKNKKAESDGYSTIFKLIMTPLIGIMSSKCDASVHASCLNTWSYLLHKLGTAVSCESVLKKVWEPILEVIFRVGPHTKSIWLVNFCLDLLDNLISTGNNDIVNKQHVEETCQLFAKSPINFTWKHYPIEWSGWDLCQLDFFMKPIGILINQSSVVTVAPEISKLGSGSSLRLFRSLMKAVQNALRCSSITYHEVMLCLNTILGFLQEVCEDPTPGDGYSNNLHYTYLQFLEAAAYELGPLILESPLYKVALDLKCIQNTGPTVQVSSATVLGIHFVGYMDMVQPVVYLCTLYFHVVVNSAPQSPEFKSLLVQMQGYLKFMFSSYDPFTVLDAFISLLYKQKVYTCIEIWVVLATCLKDYIDGNDILSLIKRESGKLGYRLLLHLLSYPFAVFTSSEINFELQHVSEAWRFLYVSFDHASKDEFSPLKGFTEDLCKTLNQYFDGNIFTVDDGHFETKNQDVEFLPFCGSAIICVMEQLTFNLGSEVSKNIDGEPTVSSSKNSMELVAGFMKLLLLKEDKTAPTSLSLTSRFLLALIQFVGCLHLKGDIITFIEAISSPMLQLLASLPEEKGDSEVQLLWVEILNVLLRCRPPVNFNSSFLKFQEPFLEITLDHLNPIISEPTISFWNSTYGKQFNLDYPTKLLPILDKLSRNGKLYLSRSCYIRDSMTTPQRYKVTATLNRCSKRVELVNNGTTSLPDSSYPSRSKRKCPELTDHQKEVRRAQQGRVRDCNGHGPGIRTYTMADFSQDNEESQDSQDIRDTESILEMLRKAG